MSTSEGMVSFNNSRGASHTRNNDELNDPNQAVNIMDIVDSFNVFVKDMFIILEDKKMIKT